MTTKDEALAASATATAMDKQVPLMTADQARHLSEHWPSLDGEHFALEAIASGEAVVVSRAAVERVIADMRERFADHEDGLNAANEWADKLQRALNGDTR